MRKKHFIALAEAVAAYNDQAFPPGTNTVSPLRFSHTQLLCLADFCQSQGNTFDRVRWFAYLKRRGVQP